MTDYWYATPIISGTITFLFTAYAYRAGRRSTVARPMPLSIYQTLNRDLHRVEMSALLTQDALKDMLKAHGCDCEACATARKWAEANVYAEF